jgi:lambda family phage portal protein
MSKRKRQQAAIAGGAASDPVVAARTEAETAYWKLASETIEKQRQAMGTYNGAIESRVDEPWVRASGEMYVGSGGVRQQNYETLKSLRDRSRNLERNNLLACGVLDRVVENVVGTTFRIEPKTLSREFNTAARAWWKGWANTTACDVRGRLTFGAILRMAYRAKKRDGDVGIVLAETGDEDGGDFPPRPRLQVIEPERICSPRRNEYAIPKGNQIVDGVEMNAYGRAIAYWVDGGGYLAKPARVDARDFVFMAHTTRYGDTRGEPGFTGGFGLFGQIMGYLEASVIAARVGASQAMIAKRRDPNAARNALGTMQVMPPNPNVQATAEKWMDIQPGMLHFLNIDEDLVPFNPAHPQQQLPDAIATFARFVGVKFGLTIEQVMLDFSRTTFSSGKMARIQAEATAEIEQEDLATNVVSRIYQWAISKAVKLGEIRVKPPADLWSHEWIPGRRPSPQPEKDIDVAERAVKLGVDARGYIAKSLYGYEFEEVCQQNKADREAMANAGLPIDDAKPAASSAPSPKVEDDANPGRFVDAERAAIDSMDKQSAARGWIDAGAEGAELHTPDEYRRMLKVARQRGSAMLASFLLDVFAAENLEITEPSVGGDARQPEEPDHAT